MLQQNTQPNIDFKLCLVRISEILSEIFKISRWNLDSFIGRNLEARQISQDSHNNNTDQGLSKLNSQDLHKHRTFHFVSDRYLQLLRCWIYNCELRWWQSNKIVASDGLPRRDPRGALHFEIGKLLSEPGYSYLIPSYIDECPYLASFKSPSLIHWSLLYSAIVDWIPPSPPLTYPPKIT